MSGERPEPLEARFWRDVRRRIERVLPDVVTQNLTVKLMVLFVLGMAISGAVLVVSYGTIQDQVTTQADAQIESETSLQAAIYENWLRERWTTLNRIAADEEIHHDSETVVHQWLTAEATNIPDDIQSLHVVDANTGDVVGSTDTWYHDRNLYDLGLEESVTGDLLFISREPINPSEDRPKMTLIGTRSDDRLLIAAVPTDTEVVRSQAFDSAESSLYSLSGHRLVGDGSEDTIDVPAEDGGPAVTEVGDTVYGKQIIAHDLLDASPVRQYDEATTVGTLVVTSASSGEVYAIRGQVTEDLALSFLITFVLLIGTAAVAMRSITVSINRLSDRARQISEGTFDVDVSSERNDEIGGLYESVGQMRDSLQMRIEKAEERERKLEEREEKYRNLFEETNEALMLLDRDGFFDCNERTLELFRADSVDEFVDYAPWELSPETQPDGTPSKEAALSHVEEAFETGRDFFEWRHSRTDGTEFQAEVKLSRITYDGEPALHALVRDITERKRQKQQLKAERNRIQAITNAIPDVTIVYDSEGHYQEILTGRASLLAEDEEKLLGSAVDEVMAPDIAQQIRVAIEESLATGTVQTVEYSIEVDGEQTWFEGRLAPLPSEERKEVVMLARDVTERKEYENQIERQRDNLEVLNQMVRHDIRNDLQLIIAYTELLTRDDLVAEAGSDHVETVLENAESAVELTQTAKDLADVMLKPDRELEPVDVGQVIDSEVGSVRSGFEDAVVTTEGLEQEAIIEADEMLDSVFRNLIKNAIQHNDEPVPEVNVSLTERDDRLRVRIADNGPGIPDSLKDEIFGKGEKGLDSTGTGIGLYLVNTLVERYGGAVWIEDNDPKGAVFVVELPKATGER